MVSEVEPWAGAAPPHYPSTSLGMSFAGFVKKKLRVPDICFANSGMTRLKGRSCLWPE